MKKSTRDAHTSPECFQVLPTPFDKGDDTWITFTTSDGLASNYVNDIALDGGGCLWFGTRSGVSVLDHGGTPFSKRDDTWATFTTSDGLADNTVYEVVQDDVGRFWFGTSVGGVSALYDGGTPFIKGDDTWITFTTSDGLADNNVWAIFPDGEGNLWFGTRSGIGELVDEVAPTSSASSPECASDAIPVFWTASDGASSIFNTTLWVKYGSGGTWTNTGLVQRGEITGTFNYTPTQGDGIYYFATVAEDWMSNSQVLPTGSGDDSTICETVAPESSASSPDYDDSGNIVVSWAASDATSGVSSTNLWVKYGSGGVWNSTGLNQAGTSGNFDYTPTWGDGTYYFATVAIDNAGNSESPPTGSGDDSTMYDTTAPTARASSPASTVQHAFTVSWLGVDATSGIAGYDVQYLGGSVGTWQDWQSNTTQTSATFGPSDPVVVQDEETYYFRARAYDRAGNVGEYAPEGDCSTFIGYSYVYLPLLMSDHVPYFEGPWEVEDNDSSQQANGPLRSGQDYYGYPDDLKDYFSIYLRTGGTITIDLSNHTGQGVQLQLFYQSVDNRVAYDLDPPYHVEYSGQAGWYYVYIYTESGHNSSTPYTLRVTYPQ